MKDMVKGAKGKIPKGMGPFMPGGMM